MKLYGLSIPQITALAEAHRKTFGGYPTADFNGVLQLKMMWDRGRGGDAPSLEQPSDYTKALLAQLDKYRVSQNV